MKVLFQMVVAVFLFDPRRDWLESNWVIRVNDMTWYQQTFLTVLRFESTTPGMI